MSGRKKCKFRPFYFFSNLSKIRVGGSVKLKIKFLSPYWLFTKDFRWIDLIGLESDNYVIGCNYFIISFLPFAKTRNCQDHIFFARRHSWRKRDATLILAPNSFWMFKRVIFLCIWNSHAVIIMVQQIFPNTSKETANYAKQGLLYLSLTLAQGLEFHVIS